MAGWQACGRRRRGGHEALDDDRYFHVKYENAFAKLDNDPAKLLGVSAARPNRADLAIQQFCLAVDSRNKLGRVVVVGFREHILALEAGHRRRELNTCTDLYCEPHLRHQNRFSWIFSVMVPIPRKV